MKGSSSIMLNKARYIARTHTKLFTQATILCSSTLILSSVSASEFDLRISDDAIHGNITITKEDSDAQFGAGYFYKNEDNAINIMNLDLHTKGQTAIANLPTTIGIGLQANLFKEEDFKGSAVGIGGSMRVNIPDAPGLSIETALHYAPKVLSFSDSDEFRRFRLQANYRIIESADISLGYRYLNVGVEDANKNHTFESGAFLGLKLSF
tara:strand:+ start:126 stop:752 length:627 start_codon:yes stop_codon:yes gene_type:complete